jgi:hypothetical protein
MEQWGSVSTQYTLGTPKGDPINTTSVHSPLSGNPEFSVWICPLWAFPSNGTRHYVPFWGLASVVECHFLKVQPHCSTYGDFAPFQGRVIFHRAHRPRFLSPSSLLTDIFGVCPPFSYGDISFILCGDPGDILCVTCF